MYAASFENSPHMLNKENYVPWSSRLLCYAKSRRNGKLIYNSIMNGLYVRRMIPEPGDADHEQMMKGYDIGIQEKKAKLLNEWERFTSIDGESIESYYHQWSRHVTIVHQTKDLHTADYTQLYDFLKYNQKEIRCYNYRGLDHLTRNCTFRPRRKDAAYFQTQLLITQKEEAGIQLQAEEFDLMDAATDLDEIGKVNANCILMANLQQESTSGTQTDKAPVYDSNGLTEVQLSNNCYNNEIFTMFNQEEQYIELLEPILKPYQVLENDSNVISEAPSVE
nr:hypothetical protein [Tanacetum cinerariifolium]